MADRTARNQYTQLPPIVQPTDFVVEVPAFEDDRPAPPPIPPLLLRSSSPPRSSRAGLAVPGRSAGRRSPPRCSSQGCRSASS
jgi:hypothetical protein